MKQMLFTVLTAVAGFCVLTAGGAETLVDAGTALAKAVMR